MDSSELLAEKECKLEKMGTDSYIGDYFSAPCGWSTYNKLDVSHYKWHEINARLLLKGRMVDEPS